MIARVHTPVEEAAPEHPAGAQVRVPSDQAPLFHVPGPHGGWYVSLLYGHNSAVDVPMRTPRQLLAGSRGEVIVARRLTPAEAGLFERRRLDCDADVHAGIIPRSGCDSAVLGEMAGGARRPAGRGAQPDIDADRAERLRRAARRVGRRGRCGARAPRGAPRGVHQPALVLCGEGDLVPVARELHRCALGDERPFVLCDPIRRATDDGAQLENRRTGVDAIGAATGGVVCLRARRLPRDFAALVVGFRDALVQLVICGQQPPKLTELVLAPIKIPALATRTHELDRIIDADRH